MSTRISVIFPYSTKHKDQGVVFSGLSDMLREIHTEGGLLHNFYSEEKKPILVVNKDSMASYEKFVESLRIEERKKLGDRIDVLRVWAVDTCQMWLSGFGKILDDEDGARQQGAGGTSTVLQIPGDLTQIPDITYFLQQIAHLALVVDSGQNPRVALCLGDFDTEQEGAKHLIDTYGTFPLLFNWFPAVAAKVREKPLTIKRPRSEFFAISVKFLREMMRKRKFAYEQTMAFLIYALFEEKQAKEDETDGTIRWLIQKRPIGTVRDYGSERGFREATDQIERTERMLKVLWRELNKGDEFDVNEFERLDRRSTAIREAAMVTLENVLKPPKSGAAPQSP